MQQQEGGSRQGHKPSGGRRSANGIGPRMNGGPRGYQDGDAQRVGGFKSALESALPNGNNHGSSNGNAGQIPAIHANGYPHHKPTLSLGELSTADLEKRSLDLCANVAKLQTEADAIRDILNERSELDALRTKLQEATDQAAAAKRDHEATQERLNSQLTAASNDVQSLRNHMAQNTQQVQYLEEQIRGLQNALTTSHQDLEEKNHNIVIKDGQVRDANDRCEEAQQQIARLSSQVSSLEDQLKQERLQHEQQAQNAAKHDAEVMTALNEWQVYGNTRDSELRTARSAASNLHKQIAHLTAENEHLRHQVSQFPGQQHQQHAQQQQQQQQRTPPLPEAQPQPQLATIVSGPHHDSSGNLQAGHVPQGVPMQYGQQQQQQQQPNGIQPLQLPHLIGCFISVFPRGEAAARQLGELLPVIQANLQPYTWSDYQQRFGSLEQFLRSHPEAFGFRQDGAVFVHSQPGPAPVGPPPAPVICAGGQQQGPNSRDATVARPGGNIAGAAVTRPSLHAPAPYQPAGIVPPNGAQLQQHRQQNGGQQHSAQQRPASQQSTEQLRQPPVQQQQPLPPHQPRPAPPGQGYASQRPQTLHDQLQRAQQAQHRQQQPPPPPQQQRPQPPPPPTQQQQQPRQQPLLQAPALGAVKQPQQQPSVVWVTPPAPGGPRRQDSSNAAAAGAPANGTPRQGSSGSLAGDATGGRPAANGPPPPGFGTHQKPVGNGAAPAANGGDPPQRQGDAAAVKETGRQGGQQQQQQQQAEQAGNGLSQRKRPNKRSSKKAGGGGEGAAQGTAETA